MSKISIITTRLAEEATLLQLRDLGVVHVSTTPIESEDMERLVEERSNVSRAQMLIADGDDGTHTGAASSDVSAQTVVDTILNADRAIDEAHGTIDRLDREIARIEKWGDFSPDSIHELEKSGVKTRLYELPPDQSDVVPMDRRIELFRDKSIVRFCAIFLAEDEPPEEIGSFTLPEASLSSLIEQRNAHERIIADQKAVIAAQCTQKKNLANEASRLDSEIEKVAVGGQFEGTGVLSWITGYAPTADVPRLQDAATKNGWGIVTREPEVEDPVPTKVRNPRVVGIIQPVFDMLGTVPGYRELDISFWFLLFLTLFFAMIIGDGGYGTILLVGTLWATAKTKKAGRSVGPGLFLMLVLSFATIVWGAITGNWFGYEGFSKLPILRDLIVPALYAHDTVSSSNIQFLCFVIGTVHLSIAHGWSFLKGLKEKPRLRAFADLGMLSMVLGLYYLVLQLVLDPALYPMPSYSLYMIGGGFVFVLLFSNQEEGKNVFVGAVKGLSGIITIALDSISAFSDIISYIRLYAVGLATFAIAQSFNQMAEGIAGGGGVGGAVAAAIVLIMGHTLNLAMGALSVIVHGVRLNMLEFSGHLGMEWTGVAYAPFRKTKTA